MNVLYLCPYSVTWIWSLQEVLNVFQAGADINPNGAFLGGFRDVHER